MPFKSHTIFYWQQCIWTNKVLREILLPWDSKIKFYCSGLRIPDYGSFAIQLKKGFSIWRFISRLIRGTRTNPTWSFQDSHKMRMLKFINRNRKKINVWEFQKPLHSNHAKNDLLSRFLLPNTSVRVKIRQDRILGLSPFKIWLLIILKCLKFYKNCAITTYFLQNKSVAKHLFVSEKNLIRIGKKKCRISIWKTIKYFVNRLNHFVMNRIQLFFLKVYFVVGK